jgi:hypothetical protein
MLDKMAYDYLDSRDLQVFSARGDTTRNQATVYRLFPGGWDAVLAASGTGVR